MSTRHQKAAVWSEFVAMVVPDPLSATAERQGFHYAWRNNRYLVYVRVLEIDETALGVPGALWLSIKRLDKLPIHDWRDLQRIKNELCGREREAVEIYPAESRLVDEANQYHLWVLPPGASAPFGFPERSVSGEDEAIAVGARQRPLELTPTNE
jgi:hypothetical protein